MPSQEEIVAQIRDKASKYVSSLNTSPLANNSLPGANNPLTGAVESDTRSKAEAIKNKYRNTSYTSAPMIDVDTNYKRLNDGTYQANTENFLGNTGNENRLASQQSSGAKFMNGVGKFVGKTVTYATDATVGTLYGLYNGAVEGSWQGVWDNDFSKSLDDINTQMDGALPNYYTDAEKNMNVFQSMGTMNFWANDFGNGMAFVTGNILSGKAIGVVTKGFKMANALPQLGLKAGNKSTILQVEKQLAKQGVTNTDEILGGVKGLSEGGFDINRVNKALSEVKLNSIVEKGNKNILKQTSLGKLGEGIDIAAFAIRSSTFEAGMESRHNLKEATDAYLDKYIAENGHEPSAAEMSEFMNGAISATNGVFAANMAILAPSNLIMFGKATGIGTKALSNFNSIENKMLGKGINITRTAGKVEAAAIVPTRLQKNVSRVNSLLGKAAVEGLFEEGLQGVAGKTMQKYLEDKYDPDSSGLSANMWNSLSDAFTEQYTTKEGFKEIFIGALIGGIGGPGLQTSPKKFISNVANNWTQKNTKIENEKQAATFNKANQDLQTRMSSFSALKKTSARQHLATEGFDFNDPGKRFTNYLKKDEQGVNFSEALAEDAAGNWSYLNMVDGLRSDEETIEDYNFVVDNITFSEEVAKETGLTKDQFEEYKAGLKENFQRQSQLSRKVKNAVDALGIEGQVDLGKGNIREAKDVLAHTIFMGMESLPIAKNIAKQLDDALGTNGTFDSMSFYENLNDEQLGLVNEFTTLQQEIEAATKASLELQSSRYTQTDRITKGGNKGVTNASQARLNRIRESEQKENERLVQLNDKIRKNEDRLTQIRETLGRASKASKFGVSETFGLTTEGLIGFDVDAVLGQINELDNYLNDLRKEGKVKEASVIETLLEDFQVYSGRFREYQKMQRDMLSPDFFKKKKGRYLLSDIIGAKYTMSDKLKQRLEENDEKVLKSLAGNGYNIEGLSATEFVKKQIEENENLSEREKFRAERLIKAALMNLSILSNTTSIEDIAENTPKSESKLKKGDTISFAKELEKDPTLTNSQQLDKLIKTIIDEVNAIFKTDLPTEVGTNTTSAATEAEIEAKKAEIEKRRQEEFEYGDNYGRISELKRVLDNTIDDTGSRSTESAVNIGDDTADIMPANKRGTGTSFLQGGAEVKLTKEESLERENIESNLTGREKVKARFDLGQRIVKRVLQEELDKINAKYDAELKALEEGQKSTQTKGEKLDMLSREDFDQLKALLDKQQSEELTEVEEQDLEILKDKFDRWTTMDGVVVGGMRLSDLVKMSLALKKMSTETQDDTFTLEGFESMAISEFEQRLHESFYNILQSPISATIIGKGEEISIQSISLGALATELGATASTDVTQRNSEATLTFDNVTGSPITITDISDQEYNDFIDNGIVTQDRINQIANKIKNAEGLTVQETQIFNDRTSDINNRLVELQNPASTKTISVKTDSRNNIILSKEDVAFINENTNVIIKPTNKDLTTRYSILLKRDSAGNITPVKSDFTYQGEVIEEQAIYDLKPNQELTLILDPQDEYNQSLLSEFGGTTARTEDQIKKEWQKRLKKLRKTNEDYDQAKTDLEFLKPTAPLYKEAKKLVDRLEAEVLAQVEIDIPTSDVKLTPEQRQQLVDNMVVKVYDADGNLVGVLKAGRGKYESETEQKFATLRKNVVMTHLDRVIKNPSDRIDVSDNNIKVKDIFLGHPNYKFNERGEELGTVYSDFTEQDAQNVVDIGYMHKGKITLKNSTAKVDTTYLGAFKKDEVKRIAFIVVDYKGRNIALPVNIKSIDKTKEIEELESVLYNERIDPAEKVIKVAGMLANLGVDPNVRGNSLEYYTESDNNFTEENYEKILANVKGKPYLYDIESAIASPLDAKTIAINEMQKNIDMNEPFHSPKIEIDMSDIAIDPSVANAPVVKKKNKASVPSTDTSNEALNILNNCI